MPFYIHLLHLRFILPGGGGCLFGGAVAPSAGAGLLSEVLRRANITVFLLELVPAQILFLIKRGALFFKGYQIFLLMEIRSLCF